MEKSPISERIMASIRNPDPGIIVNSLEADSLDVVELLMTLEDNTGKTIPEEKVTDLSRQLLTVFYFFLIFPIFFIFSIPQHLTKS